MNASDKNYQPIESSSDYDTVVQLRYKYMSPSLRTFQAYEKAVVLKKGRDNTCGMCRIKNMWI